jgi:hypothetical protein
VFVAVDGILEERIRLVLVARTLDLSLVPDDIICESKSFFLKDFYKVSSKWNLPFSPTLDLFHVVIVNNVTDIPNNDAMVVKNTVCLSNYGPHIVKIGLKVGPC